MPPQVGPLPSSVVHARPSEALPCWYVVACTSRYASVGVFDCGVQILLNFKSPHVDAAAGIISLRSSAGCFSARWAWYREAALAMPEALPDGHFLFSSEATTEGWHPTLVSPLWRLRVKPARTFRQALRSSGRRSIGHMSFTGQELFEGGNRLCMNVALHCCRTLKAGCCVKHAPSLVTCLTVSTYTVHSHGSWLLPRPTSIF